MLGWYRLRAVATTVAWSLAALLGLAVAGAGVYLATRLDWSHPAAWACVPVIAWMLYLGLVMPLNPILVPASDWHRVALRRWEEARAAMGEDFVPSDSARVATEVRVGPRIWPWWRYAPTDRERVLRPSRVERRAWSARVADGPAPRRAFARLDAWLQERELAVFVVLVVGGAAAIAGLAIPAALGVPTQEALR